MSIIVDEVGEVSKHLQAVAGQEEAEIGAIASTVGAFHLLQLAMRGHVA